MDPKRFKQLVVVQCCIVVVMLVAVGYFLIGYLTRDSQVPPALEVKPAEPPSALPLAQPPLLDRPRVNLVKPFVSDQPLTPAPGHWPQWRGPNRDNVSTETGLLRSWPVDGPPRLWQTNDIGEGKGGISVAGGLIFALGYRNGLEFLTALDGAGRTAWAVPIGPALKEAYHMRWLSQRTPTVDDDRVFALTARGKLLCLRSTNGDMLWQRDYALDFGGKPGGWGGFCDFPLADGPLVICTPAGPSSTVVALDRRTGATVWSCDVAGNSVGSQSTLFPCRLAGIRQYVTQLDRKIVGISAETGRLLWSYPAGQGGVQVAIALDDHTVAALDGWGGMIETLELKPNGDRLVPSIVYSERSEMDPWFANELRLGDRLYGVSSREIYGFELRAGKRFFRNRSTQGFRTSTMSDGLLYLRGVGGDLALAEPTEKGVEILSTFKLARRREDLMTFPVVAGGRLYLRDQEQLLCFDVRSPEYREPIPVWDLASRVRPATPGIPGPALGAPPGEPDAIFVPTPMDVVDRMLALAGVTKTDRVVDLGSGDGRILLAASGKYGCRSTGFEIDPELVRESRARIRDRGLASLAVVEDRDLFKADLEPFSVVTLYLGEKNNARLLPQLRRLKPGSRIVSHAHDLGIPGLTPDKSEEVHSREDGVPHTIYLWTVPLKIQ